LRGRASAPKAVTTIGFAFARLQDLHRTTADVDHQHALDRRATCTQGVDREVEYGIRSIPCRFCVLAFSANRRIDLHCAIAPASRSQSFFPAAHGAAKHVATSPTCGDNSCPADRSDGYRMFPSEKNFLRLMTDRQFLALAQGVFDILHTEFDFQKLVAIRNRKPKYRIVLGRTTRSER
jgi:hypothetical protein